MHVTPWWSDADHEAPRNRAHTSRALADPRDRRRLPGRGRVGAPTPGGPGDFPLLMGLVASADPERGGSAVVRALFAVRWKLGELLGWDEQASGTGARVATLRDRLPADLRDGPAPPRSSAGACRSARCTSPTTSGRRRSPIGRCMASCTSGGCPTGLAATAARWRSWSSATVCWGTPTWPRSCRFATYRVSADARRDRAPVAGAGSIAVARPHLIVTRRASRARWR